jgi:hypothetical protein
MANSSAFCTLFSSIDEGIVLTWLVVGTRSEPCMRGHRSSKCTHGDRILIRVRKPGRPLSSCPHSVADCNCGGVRVAIPKGTSPWKCPQLWFNGYILRTPYVNSLQYLLVHVGLLLLVHLKMPTSVLHRPVTFITIRSSSYPLCYRPQEYHSQVGYKNRNDEDQILSLLPL